MRLVIGKQYAVAQARMAEVVVDAVFLAQPLDERQVALAVLHAVVTGWVRLFERN
jgi:hypothetical protein